MKPARWVFVPIALALVLVLGLACREAPEETPHAAPSFDKDTPVAHLYLDDVWPAPGGQDAAALYFRALDAYRENVDLIDLRGLIVEQDGEILPGKLNLAELRNAENEGVSIVVALDHSNVTADGGALEQTKRALLELVGHIESAGWERHALAVVGFAADRVEVVSFDASADEARAAIRALEPDADAYSAALYDGLDYSIQILRDRQDIPRRSLILLVSDGRNSLEEQDPENRDRFIQPQRRIDAVLSECAAADGRGAILLHALGHPIPPWHEQHIELLDELATATGGEYLRTRHPDELGALMLGVWDDANRSIKAMIPARMDGEPHRLRLRIGRRNSTAQVVTYPQHFEIGPGLLLGGFGALALAGLVGLIVYLRRPGHLVLANAETAGQSFRLSQGQTRIGAAADNDIQLVDASVSDYHATIVINGRTVYIEDQGGSNTTFINGEVANRRALESGDRIRFGSVEARFER